jgi:hypothetical protein
VLVYLTLLLYHTYCGFATYWRKFCPCGLVFAGGAFTPPAHHLDPDGLGDGVGDFHLTERRRKVEHLLA